MKIQLSNFFGVDISSKNIPFKWMPSLDTLSIDECSTAGLEFRNPTLNYFRKSLRKKPRISEDEKKRKQTDLKITTTTKKIQTSEC